MEMPAAQTADTTAAETTSPRKMAYAVGFASIGWAFDMFDLFIFLYTASILSRVFFESSGSMLSLAGVYAAFAATLVMRPLGGILFGQYADRKGRKSAMILASVGIGIATALTGAIPAEHTIGLAAPIIFILLRLVHGIFMGGMVASTHTIGTETISKRWRGLASGTIAGGGSALGKLAISLLFILVGALLPGPLFDEWGWRVLFFSGILSSVLGLMVFSKVEESPMWLAEQRAKRLKGAQDRAPLAELIRNGHLVALIHCTLLAMAGSGLTYLVSGYLATILRLVSKVPPEEIGIILACSAIFGGLIAILSGWLTDVLGRRTGAILYGILAIVGLPIFYLQLGSAHGLVYICLLVLGLTGIMTAAYSPVLIMLNERFPTSVRSSGTAISWNIGYALGGSLTVLTSLLSHSSADLPEALAIMTGCLGALYLVLVVLLRKQSDQMA